ncbi:hypothetical protein [uncultured Thiodictyon sp.]|uniref:hypothetical protein n=1 Tax=uncultured Thiodictyon sp. TaxID=1846217 RepID=UPI0025D73D0D|nr:hypothetical protein [uncultured Thiodictyon sp.]
MNHSILITALILGFGLVACDKPPTVVAVPTAVPGPAGPQGATGDQGAKGTTGAPGRKGETGKPGDTILLEPATPPK